MLDLYDELTKLIDMLHSGKIEYALCGGLAMAVHAFPRATVDIDIMVEKKDLDAVLQVARSAGYTARAAPMTFAGGAIEVRRVSKLDPESRDVLMLDVLVVTPTIRSVWETRQIVRWAGGDLSVVSKEGLITLKHLRGSPLDIEDIKKLEEKET